MNMSLAGQPVQTRRHFRRNVVIVVVVVLILLVGAVAVWGFTYGLYGCFGPNGCAPSHAIYPTALSCGIKNDSCEVVISNGETSIARAMGCEFQSIYTINTNGQTVTSFGSTINNQSLTLKTVNNGAGVLSNEPGGLPMNISIAAGTSGTVYCTEALHPSPSISAGSQAAGEILFTNESLDIQFLGTWH
jgi:hypothetical protein